MLLNDIIISLAGRTVEFLFLGEDMISTGVNCDLDKTTNIVLEIVIKYEMNNVRITQFTSHNYLKAN